MNYLKNSAQIKESGLQLRESLAEGRSAGPLVVEVLKQYYDEPKGKFDCFGKILSGTVKKGQRVRVLGAGFTPFEQKDAHMATVEELSLVMQGGRYKI